MKFLRTVSTRRLLAIIVGFVTAVAAGTAIAVAASGNGPVPPRKPLARAVHNALGAPKITGISARIQFTNHLIDSSDIQGADPILSGASGRLWLSSDHRLRLELQSDNGDAQVVVNNGSFWVYDPSSHTAYEGTLPTDRHKATEPKQNKLPSIGEIQTDIDRITGRANLSGALPSDVAGRAAYTVRLSPKHDGGLLGAGEMAWDAIRGVPLRFAIYAKNDGSPVLELKATDISYGPVSSSVFAISPPSGAKIVKVATPTGSAASKRMHERGLTKAQLRRRHHQRSGMAAVAKHVPFALVAPSKLVGLPRRSVSLLDWGGSPAALVAYGQNLGGVAVIEQAAKSGTVASQSAQNGQGADHGHLSLPTVSINGATGQELDTALGTMVRFTRNGVSYTVLGSVPAAAADAAARAL